MALTQSARIPGPGPSWDEEVVPVLRKRLESESRTLARRISAISASSNEDLTSDATYTPSAYSNPRAGTRPDPAPRTSSERNINSTRVNGAASTSSQRPPSARSRTYSQPYQVDSHSTKGKQVNGSVNGTSRSPDNLSTNSSTRPISPRPSVSDTPKPSRIPQPTRSRAISITGHSQFSHQNAVDGLPYGSPHTPHTHTQQDPSRSADLWIVHEAPPTSTSSASSITSAQRGGPGLLQEPAPFKPGSTSSSTENLDPPRPSIDSEERPFEHWYRGEVSRNGGVGELRVAKRQEMLEIANFGHDLDNTKKPRNAITDAIEERRRRRKRADSLGLVGERASFYMDEEKAREIARVMDENPPTDLEDGDQMDYDDEDVDEEDDQSEYYDPPDRSRSSSDHYNPSTTATMTPTASSSSRYDPRSTTPTPATVGGRSSSRNQHHPRTTTPTQRGRTEQPSIPGASASTPSLLSTPPNNHNSKSRPGQQQSRTKSHGTPSSSTMGSPSPSTPQGGKRGASPGTPASGSGSANKKSRMAASKATQAKLAEKKKKEELEKKRSVAYYPDPGVDEDMAHAIPTWTQPVPKQGNWDDVVLPVVARKKGLDGHFEQVDGSPRPKHSLDTVAPAPGTFGYDHSKYRPPREDLGEGIPMDEFGQPMPMRQRQEGQGDDMDMDNQSSNPYASSNPHDEIRLPASMSNSASGSRSQQNEHQQSPPSPAPFSHYPLRTGPRSTEGMSLNGNPSGNGMAEVDLERLAQQQGQKKEQEAEEEANGGCCNCVVM